MTNEKTPCECPLAGFCKKHDVEKNSHLHKLCQTNVKYFNLWEKCKGPLQNFLSCIKRKPATETEQANEAVTDKPVPGLFSQAKSLISSATKHVASGMGSSSEEEQQKRMSICQGCEYMRSDRRCSKCGCFLDTKIKWKTSSCPIGRW